MPTHRWRKENLIKQFVLGRAIHVTKYSVSSALCWRKLNIIDNYTPLKSTSNNYQLSYLQGKKQEILKSQLIVNTFGIFKKLQKNTR